MTESIQGHRFAPSSANHTLCEDCASTLGKPWHTTLEVALVGFASSSRELANQLPPEVEIWGCNQLYRAEFLQRADRWFELHSRTIYDTQLEVRRPAEYIRWLASFTGPVYMLSEQPDIKSSVRYPIEEVVADVGDYLTSSMSYMLALAIHERAETIHIYGVDMATKSEYAEQRAGFEYLLGLARGRGIRIMLPPVCPLLKGPLYGRGELNPAGERITDSQFAARLQALEVRKAEIEQRLNRLAGERQQIEGAILETTYWINTTPEGAPQELLRG